MRATGSIRRTQRSRLRRRHVRNNGSIKVNRSMRALRETAEPSLLCASPRKRDRPRLFPLRKIGILVRQSDGLVPWRACHGR